MKISRYEWILCLFTLLFVAYELVCYPFSLSQTTTFNQPDNEAVPYYININTATAAELEELDGIGPKTAKLIIEYRQSNGEFENIDELCNVSGIGTATLNNIKDYIKV